jgi:hypothetical protein
VRHRVECRAFEPERVVVCVYYCSTRVVRVVFVCICQQGQGEARRQLARDSALGRLCLGHENAAAQHAWTQDLEFRTDAAAAVTVCFAAMDGANARLLRVKKLYRNKNTQAVKCRAAVKSADFTIGSPSCEQLPEQTARERYWLPCVQQRRCLWALSPFSPLSCLCSSSVAAEDKRSRDWRRIGARTRLLGSVVKLLLAAGCVRESRTVTVWVHSSMSVARPCRSLLLFDCLFGSMIGLF